MTGSRSHASGARRTRLSSEYAVGLDRELEYGEMVDDGIAMMRSRRADLPGALLAGFWCSGRDWESMTVEEIDAFTVGLQSVLYTLGYGWMLHFQVIRRIEHRYRRVAFAEAIDDVIDQERERNAYYYVTRRALFLTRAPNAFDFGFAKRLKHLVSGPSMDDALDEHIAHISEFERLAEEFGQRLGRLVQVRRMRHHADNDELLQALKLCARGVDEPGVLPDGPVGLNELLSDELSWTKRSMRHAGSYVSLVRIARFPKRCGPLFLRELTMLPCEFRWATRFIPLDQQRNEKLLAHRRREWKQKELPLLNKLLNIDGEENLDAVAKGNQMAEAQREFDGRSVRFGLYTLTLEFRAATQEEADNNARKAIDVMGARGIVAQIEEHNKTGVYLGTQPGHHAQNPRKTPMHTGHVANLLALTEEFAGEAVHPCPDYAPNSAPLMQVRNWSGGPYNLSLHGAGSKLGHTVVFGPSQTGKSFLLASVASQHMKFRNAIGPAQVFFLDVGRSMLAYTLARADGAHYQVGGKGGLRLCPLADLDTDSDRGWASVWLQDGFQKLGVVLTDKHRHRIDDALRRLAACSSVAAERTLTHLLPHLLGSGLEMALSYYIDGPGGEVLNGDTVEIEDANFITFELGELKEYGEAVGSLARSYIWRVIHKRCDGRPSMLVIDELTRSLPDLENQQKVTDALNTLAKENCAVVLATQQVDQVLKSPMANAVLEVCVTKILLPNPGMSDDMRQLYIDKLNATPAQVALIQRVQPKRFYLVLKEARARLISLDAGPVAKAFFGARSEAELRVIAELMDSYGQQWPEFYLRNLGMVEQAEAFGRHFAKQTGRAA
jgi:type IV secretion/conjugal transfer VirB4 family ATPase